MKRKSEVRSPSQITEKLNKQARTTENSGLSYTPELPENKMADITMELNKIPDDKEIQDQLGSFADEKTLAVCKLVINHNAHKLDTLLVALKDHTEKSITKAVQIATETMKTR